MSLQRVFESARKMGVPVIVTDPAGRDPMVVLPLEQFEAMAGAVDVRQDIPKKDFVDFSQSKGKKEQEETAKDVRLPVEEIPLEDRFYIEPLDEQAGP